jgi:RNA-directed DNA polymerase
MKFTAEQNNIIRELFKQMDSKNDFLELLNEAKRMIYGEKVIAFELTQLNYYINKDSVVLSPKSTSSLLPHLNNGDARFSESEKKATYTTFTIKKKSGADRTIHAPIKGLKELQKALNLVLQSMYQPHEAATGFVLGKSIVDNAKVHVAQTYVYNLDLKDFFPSVDKARVWGRILFSPFNLNTTPDRKVIANMIAGLSCTPMQVQRFDQNEWKKVTTSVLPQGAPTSPVLTNAICEKLDKRLSGVAKRFGLNYTRYADDITFSSKHNLYKNAEGVNEKIYVENSSFDKEVRRIIGDQRFHVKESKVRLQKEGYRQEVTGLLVNDKVNVSRNYIKQLRQWIHYWEIFGYDRAYLYFLQQYAAGKNEPLVKKPNMAMVLEGKLLYLKMVKGDTDSTYLKLKNRYDILISKMLKLLSVDNILEIWETEGIESAMEAFYAKPIKAIAVDLDAEKYKEDDTVYL